MTIKSTLLTQSNGTETAVDITGSLETFSLSLVGSQRFIELRFKKMEFISQGGKKADVIVELEKVEFVGVLSFVQALKDLIPPDGFSDPPYLDVTQEGITAGYSQALPNLPMGIFSLSNLSLGARLTLPFGQGPLTVSFNFAERHEPFNLTVSLFGGGGFFAIALDPDGVQLLEGALEFGATVSLNFGVASGGVCVMAGIYFAIVKENAKLEGYLRMGGQVDVLGLISASIELYLALIYEFASRKVAGRAALTIEVEVLLFSQEVTITCERKFAGSSSDPTFADIMAPYPLEATVVFPWHDYCRAFAETF